MKEVEQRRVALKLAESLLWTPYRWGGDDPMEGVDCSGFWVEILKSLGIIGSSDDFPAAAMFDMFDSVTQYTEGDMIFWQNSNGKIVHVEMIYNIPLTLAIGASGGGSGTTSYAASVAGNAYVKIRPYPNRGRVIAGVGNPYTYRRV